MTGPMSNVDPDQVENDAGVFWRTFYKLEKTFMETSPNPLKMAQKVVVIVIKLQYRSIMYPADEDTCPE